MHSNRLDLLEEAGRTPKEGDVPMMRGMYSAISGLKTQQAMLDVAANDLANVNTVGFKGARTTFKDALQQTFKTASAAGAGVGRPKPAQVALAATLGPVD